MSVVNVVADQIDHCGLELLNFSDVRNNLLVLTMRCCL